MYPNASKEPLEVIRANECESSEPSLPTARFQALWNEIERLKKELSYRVHTDEDIEVQNKEIERLWAAFDQIIELDHYPDATIAREARGLPTTDRATVEQGGQK